MFLEIVIPVVITAVVLAGLWWFDATYEAARPKIVPCGSDPKPMSNEEVIRLISQPAVVHRRQRYVCGFAFYDIESGFRPRVVLMRKVKPDWQAGKLNGVGGKIEAGETPEVAMAREFKEETGVTTSPLEWEAYAKMTFPKAEVIFLRSFDPTVEHATTQTVWSEEVGANITEPVEHRLVRGIDEIADDRIMPNLRWAIPLAYHTEGGRGLVSVDYTEHN